MRRLAVLVALVGSACAAEDPRILSVTLPGDTRDRVGPYAVEAVIRGVADGDDVEVRWTSDPTDPDLRFVPVPARRVSPSDLFVGEIPGQPPSTPPSSSCRRMRPAAPTPTACPPRRSAPTAPACRTRASAWTPRPAPR